MLSTELQVAPPDMSSKYKLGSKLIRNRDRHTRKFQPLRTGQRVWMQHPHTKEWYQQATVVDILAGGQTYTVRSDTGSTYTRGARLLRPARQQPQRYAKARSVTAHLLYSSQISQLSTYTPHQSSSIMPKATQKTKGVSSFISSAQQYPPNMSVADQAWDLTLPKVSGDGRNNHSSIESLLGNFHGGPFGPNTLSFNTVETQPRVQDQQQQTVGSGVLHPRGPQAAPIPAVHYTQQYGGIQLQGAGESYGGGASNQTDEGLSDYQHTGRPTPILHDGEPSGSSTGRNFIRAIPIGRLQDIQILQEENQRGQGPQENRQAERGHGGDGLA